MSAVDVPETLLDAVSDWVFHCDLAKSAERQGEREFHKRMAVAAAEDIADELAHLLKVAS